MVPTLRGAASWNRIPPQWGMLLLEEKNTTNTSISAECSLNLWGSSTASLDSRNRACNMTCGNPILRRLVPFTATLQWIQTYGVEGGGTCRLQEVQRLDQPCEQFNVCAEEHLHLERQFRKETLKQKA